jgi:hypothetical protein
MASDGKIYLNVGNLLSLSPGDLDGDSVEPQFKPGGLNFLTDAYGSRIVKYVRMLAGAATKGMLVSAASGGTDQRHTAFTVQATGGTTNSTTSANLTGATADRHIGMIAFVNDKNAVAGAAPEGEAGIVADNGTNFLLLERDYPLSAALAASDVLHVIANYQVEAAGAADQAWVVEGVVIGENGIAQNNYGWVQQYGPVMASKSAGAIAFNVEVVAAASGTVETKASQTGEDFVGVALASAAADQAANKIPIKVTVFVHQNGVVA